MQRHIPALLRLLFVGGLTAVLVGIAGLATSWNDSPGPAPVDPSVPPGWNTRASPAGMSLVVDPPVTWVGSAVVVKGNLAPALGLRGRSVTIQLWPEGSYAEGVKVGSAFEPGPDIGPASTQVTIGADGTFGAYFPIPSLVEFDNRLVEVKPGRYWFALVLGDEHGIYTPFQVRLATLTPQPTPANFTQGQSIFFLDSDTGWLSAESCVPNNNGDVCKPAFYGTSDGGHSWTLLSHDDIGDVRFENSRLGIALNGDQNCENRPCSSRILRTIDGGVNWGVAYSAVGRLSNLSIVDGEAWILEDGCAQVNQPTCDWELLKSTDGGATWSRIPVPVRGNGQVPMSRPTVSDAVLLADGLFVTRDGGITWQTRPKTPPTFEGIEETFFLTTQQGWLLVGGQPGAGSQAKELFKTTDGGMTWVHASGSLEHPGEYVPGDLSSFGYVGSVLFTSSAEGWITLGRVGILRSTDGGATWAAVPNLAGDPPPIDLQFTDAEHGFALDYYGYRAAIGAQGASLVTSSDGGETWQKLPLPAPEP